MQTIGEHAIVVGASMAGLLAARVLSDAYEHVTVLDRDRLPAGMEGRRAVPQGRHAHALLSHGQACLDELLPGFSAELVADGAPACRALEDMHYVVAGHELARAATGAHSILASRPFIEGHVRRRIRALPAITIRDEVDALGVTAGDRTRVDGVRILSRADGSAEEILSADLVVAATGRAARVPAWLETLGHPRPREQKLMLDVTYATRHLRMPAGALGGDKFVLVSAKPGRPRALFLFAQEADTWVLSIGGYGRLHRPPGDPDGFAAFAATVAPPEALAAIEAAEPLDDIVHHAFPASLRRRYDRLRRFPRGLLVCGDAICSFNPTYGQGMTVAAAEAVALRTCLRDGERDLARRFFAAAAGPIGHAWDMSVTADLTLPEVPGRRSPMMRARQAYLRRLQTTAEHDLVVAGAFSAVAGMRRPLTHLRSPAVAARVLRGPRLPAQAAHVEKVGTPPRAGTSDVNELA